MYIYLLSKNEVPFYIGRSSNLKERLKGHKKVFGADIEIIELDSCDYADSIDLESFYIKKFISNGYALKNIHLNTTTKYKDKKLLNYFLKNNNKNFILNKKYVKKIKHGDLKKISIIYDIKYSAISSALGVKKQHYIY